MNKSIVTFTRGTLAQATPLWQYDYGQVLEINGLDLPATYQVHFCNCSDSQTITVLGNADGVLIPDNLLQTGKTVIAYIYLHTGADDGETEYKITIPVRPRPAPSDIPPTPEQQSALDEAIAALNSAVEDVEDIADGIPDQIDAALEEAKASGEFDGPPGTPGTDGTDGNNIWYDNSSLIESSSDVAARLADLEGRTGVSPAADDIVFAKAPRSGHIDTMYIIRRVWGPLAYLTFVATITGPQGDPGFSPVAMVTEIEGGHRVTITDAGGDHVFDVMDGSSGGGGTSDYSDLTNKPQINSVTLSGNKTAADLGLAPAGAYVKPSGGIPAIDLDADVQDLLGLAGTALQEVPSDYRTATAQDAIDAAQDLDIAARYFKPPAGIPKTDLASAVRTSLGKADTALQQVPSTYRTAADQDLIDAGKADKVQEVTVATDGVVSQALDPGKIYHFTGALTSLTITLNAPRAGQIPQYHFDFECGTAAVPLTVPNSVVMPDSFTTGANTRYEVDILSNYAVVADWVVS